MNTSVQLEGHTPDLESHLNSQLWEECEGTKGTIVGVGDDQRSEGGEVPGRWPSKAVLRWLELVGLLRNGDTPCHLHTESERLYPWLKEEFGGIG
jgi:hypothetical protein